jgi:hypothetical protein
MRACLSVGQPGRQGHKSIAAGPVISVIHGRGQSQLQVKAVTIFPQTDAIGLGVFSRTVDVHVGSLRQKIETDAKKPQLILTVPGLGYKFVG